MPDVLVSLTETRENLLREYVIARGAERATVLAKILETEAEMEEPPPPICPAVTMPINTDNFRNISPIYAGLVSIRNRIEA